MGRNRRSTFARAALIVSCIVALTTCDAFKAGLGPKIDVSSPSVDVKSLSNGAYLKGTVKLSGVASDDIGITSLALIVTIDSTQVASIAATISNGTWVAELDTKTLSGGKEVQADLTIRVTDTSGKTSDKKIVVYFDNVAPVINSMTPTAANLDSVEYALSETETLSGSVKDGLGLAKVELILGNNGELVYSNMTHPAAWTIDVDTEQFYDAATKAAITAKGAVASTKYTGLYEVPFKVVATDLAGNTSDPISGTFYVNPDGSPAVDIAGQSPAIDASIVYPNPPPSDAASIGTWKASSLAPGDTIKFRAFDLDGLDASAAGLYLLLVPGSQQAQLAAGTLDLAPYTYTVGNGLSETVLMKTQSSDGSSSIVQKADFSLTLPAALNTTTMPELGEYLLLVHSADDATNKLSKKAATANVPALSSAGATRYLSVFITKGVPTVSITSPVSGAFVKNLSAVGTIDDSFGPLAVSVSVDGGTAAYAICTPRSGSSTLSDWTFTYAGTALADGQHSATLRGENKAGKWGSSQELQFNVDTTPPSASVQSAAPEGGSNSPQYFTDQGLSAAPGGTMNVVNGVVKFKGVAVDSSVLASCSWEIQGVSSTATTPWSLDSTIVDSGGFSSSAMSLWSLDVDTTDTSKYTDGQYYVLSVTATDKSGNVSDAAQRSFQIKQSTDLPTFSLLNMDSSAATSDKAKSNLLTTKLELDATVTDDDRVDPAMIKILIDPKDGSGNPSPSGTPVNSADTSVTGTVNSTTGAVSFAYSFSATGAGTGTALAAEGRHFFYLVADDLSAWKGGKSSVASTIGPVWFAVDTKQPQVSFNQQSGGLYVSTSQALTGTVYSANVLDPTTPFSITVGSAASYPALSDSTATGSHSWSYNLDVSGKPDGTLDLTAVAKDEFGLSSTSSFTVTVDKTPPEVVTTNAAQVFSDVNGYSLVGTAKDLTSGVASMTAVLTDSSSKDVSASATLTLNAITGSPNTTGNWSLDFSGLATGSYTLKLTATDKAGNSYSPYGASGIAVIVDKDTPVVAMASPLVDGAVFNANSAIPANWTGTATDAFLASVVMKYDGTTSSAGTSGTWSIASNWASLSEGTHSLVVTASDKGGHVAPSSATFTKDTLPPTVLYSSVSTTVVNALSETTTSLTGTVSEATTYIAHIELVFDYGTSSAVSHVLYDDSASTLKFYSWSQPISSVLTDSNYLSEGSHTVVVLTRDSAGNSNSDSAAVVKLSIDRTAPTLAPASIGTYQRLSFAMTGTSADLCADHVTAGSGIKSITASVDGGTSSSVTDTSSGLDLSSWSYDLSSRFAGLSEGSHNVAFTATDRAGHQTGAALTFVKDTVAPAASFGNISGAGGTILNETVSSVTGTLNDATSGFAATYTMTKDGIAGSLSATEGSTSLGWSYDISAVAEGTHTLAFSVSDRAGNSYESGSVVFVIDRTVPTLSITTSGGYKNAAFPIIGSGSDAISGLQSVVASLDGGTAVGVTDTSTGADLSVWRYDFSLSGSGVSFGTLSQGSHTVVFTAKDKAGHQATASLSFVKDTDAPAVSFGNIVNGSDTMLTETTLALNGSASDAVSGVASLRAKLDGGAEQSLGSPGGATNPSWNTSISSLSDGTHTIEIITADQAGNEYSTGAVSFRYDRTAPTLTIGSPVEGVVYGAGFGASTGKASGTATDAFLTAVQYALDGSATYTDATYGSGAWSVDYLWSGLSSGSHSITIKATDGAGHTTTKSVSFTKDIAAPTASFTNVSADTVLQDSAPKAFGTFTDSSGVDHWEYQLEKGTWDGTAWSYSTKKTYSETLANYDDSPRPKNPSWSVTLPSGDTDQGRYKLTLKAWDTAMGSDGTTASPNVLTSDPIVFYIDRALPAASITNPSSAAIYSTTFGSLTGTASDANIWKVEVTVTGSASLGTETFTSPVIDGTSIAWTYAGWNWAKTDGTYTVSVTAYDFTGKSYSASSLSFTKDTTPPTVSYNNLAADGSTVFQETSPKITGTFADANGVVASGTSGTLEKWDYATRAWGAAATLTSANLGLGSAENAKSATFTIDMGSSALALAEGKYRLKLAASDIATPANSLAPAAVVFTIAKSNPSVAMSNPVVGSFKNGAFSVTGTASDVNTIAQILVKAGSGSVDLASGTTPAQAALAVSSLDVSSEVFTTSAAHGLSVGSVVTIGILGGGTMPATSSGTISSSTLYYVNGIPTSTSFTVSASSGGSTVDFTTTGASMLVAAAPIPISSLNTTSGLFTSSITHGLANGTVVHLNASGPSGSLPANASGGAEYYVVSATGTTFKLAASSDGSAIAFSSGAGLVVSAASTFGSSTSQVYWVVPSLSISGCTDGSLTVCVQAVAGSSRSAQASRDVTFDSTAPTVDISSPSLGTKTVGNLTIIGTTTDPGTIPSGVTGTIQYQVGKNYNLASSSNWKSDNVTGGAYSWSISLGDMSSYASSTYAIQCDASGNASSSYNFWKLPIAFQATDKAGNVLQDTSYYLILDPDGNVPVVTITQPSSSGLTFGGQQRITGTATQPTWVHDVEVSAYDASAGSCAATVPASTLNYATDVFTTASAHGLASGMKVYVKNATNTGVSGSAVNPKTAYYVINAGTTTFQLAATSTGASAVDFSNILNSDSTESLNVDAWYPATLVTTGASVIWYYDINANGEYPSSGDSQNVAVQIRAWNSPTINGSRGTISGTLSTPLKMTFNATFPQFSSISVGGATYYSQITVSGTVSLSATVSSSKGIAKLQCVESSPTSGSTTMYDTSSSYVATGSSFSHNSNQLWSATVSPPSIATSFAYSSSDKTKVMIVAAGSDPSIWTTAGATTSSVGTVFTPGSSFSTSSSGGSFIASDSSGNFNYTVTMSIATTALYSKTSGIYSFYIRATDMTSPTSQVSSQTFTLGADNYYATSTLSYPLLTTAAKLSAGTKYMIVSLVSSDSGAVATDFTSVGARANTVGTTFVATGAGSGTGTAVEVLAGSAQYIQGAATDVGTGSGTISGLSKVIVYLTRTSGSATAILPLYSGSTTSSGYKRAVYDAATGETISVTYPTAETAGVQHNYYASIDDLGLNGTTNANDGFPEGLRLSGSTYNWWVVLDSTKLTDGPVTVNYVLWDQAGNATYYSQSSFVSNYAPVLKSITLGTDLNGDGSISSAEQTTISSGYSATGFTVRNGMLSFQINLSQGSNSPLYYSVKYAGTEKNGTLTSNTLTISDFSSITDSEGINDRAFTVMVYDSTTDGSQSIAQTVNLTIQNVDSTPPTISLAPFGTVYSVGADDSTKALSLASAYSSNIGSSGGHVEYGSVNPYRYGTAIAATSIAAGSVYAITTVGTTDFTSIGASANTAGAIFKATAAGSGTGYAAPLTGTVAASALVSGQGYIILVPGTTSFTSAGAAANTAGTTFIATGATSGTGVAGALSNPPALSGQVIFRGKAYDNQRVAMITATIPDFNGSSAEFPVGEWGSSAGPSGTGGMSGMSGTGWSFSVDSPVATVESVSQSLGHVFNWSFTVETSNLSTVARTGLNVVLKAYDFVKTGTGIRGSNTIVSSALSSAVAGQSIYLMDPNGAQSPVWATVSSVSGSTATLTTSPDTALTKFSLAMAPSSATTLTQGVDVVPYVTGITTNLSSAYSSVPSVIQRSALGYYPVQEAEGDIVSGYNFNGTSTTVTLAGTSIVPSGGSKTSLDLPIGTSATSGALAITVGSALAGNNLNWNSLSYNRQANGVNNDLLTDDTYFYVWKINAVKSNDSTIRYPSMRIASSTTASKQYIGWAYDQAENYFYMTPQQSSTPVKFEGNPTRYYDTAFAFDDQGNSYGEGNSGDITAGSSSISNWSSVSFFYLKAGSVASSLNGGYNSGTYKSRIISLSSDSTSTNTNSNRVQSPDMVASLATAGSTLGDSNLATVYLSYYDAVLDQVMLRTGTVSTGSNSATGALAEKGTSSTAPWDRAGAITIASTSTTARSGQYSAIALNPVDRTTLVAVWYDASAHTLWYSYNTAPTSSATADTGQWQSHAMSIDTSFSGWYCDVIVDASGAVHIAYNQTSNGDLRYAYLPAYNSAKTALTTVTVDSYLSVGQYLKIGILASGSRYVPYISYYSSTFASTADSVKVAWRADMSSLAAGASSDKFTGAWEVMTLPLTNIPKSYSVSVGFKDFVGTGTSLTPVLGYATNSGLEYSYLK